MKNPLDRSTKLATGEFVEQIVPAHPRLTKDFIRAALGFAGRE